MASDDRCYRCNSGSFRKKSARDMTQRKKHLTIGVIPGYQLFEGNTISDYLQSVLNGIIAASHDKNCDLLMACGIDTPTTRGRYTPAWPILSPDTTFVPVGPSNTDGLI